MDPMYLFKVGKSEHLELLKDGIVHFTPLSFFRGDGTTFRGDLLEGTYVIDTSRGFFINGIDVSKLGEGFRATMTHADSDDILIFCASMLDSRNYQRVSDHVCNLTDSFIEEMRQFGQFSVIFDCVQFTNSIQNALSDMRCSSAWGPVAYCDKDDHTRMAKCIKKVEAQLSDTAIYFIKDELYQTQNEWRFAIDWLNPSSALKRNKDGSLDLQIEPIQMSNIIDLDAAKRL